MWCSRGLEQWHRWRPGLLLPVPSLLGPMGAQTSKAEISLLPLSMESQLCPLHPSSWPLCFGAVVQELIQHLMDASLARFWMPRFRSTGSSFLLSNACRGYKTYLPSGKDKLYIVFTSMIGHCKQSGDVLDLCRSLMFSFSPSLQEIQPNFLGCCSWLWASLAEQGLVCLLLITALCSYFSWCSEVATFQHWGLLKDVCRFCLLCLLRVYPAYDNRLLQQTHISGSVSGEQVPALLKINLLFWSGGVIGTERLPARIYICKARELSEQLWPSWDGLGSDCWGPDLSLPLWIPCSSLHFSLMLGARYLEVSHSPC